MTSDENKWQNLKNKVKGGLTKDNKKNTKDKRNNKERKEIWITQEDLILLY